MDTLDLYELHRFAASIAIRAGSYLRDEALARMSRTRPAHFDATIAIKENAADLVTRADTHAEQLISDAIRETYPTHKWAIKLIIGEESYSSGQEKRFLLDNTSHRVQRGLWILSTDKQPVVGAIFAPFMGGLHVTNASGTLYSAAKGHGSWSTPISFPFEATALACSGAAPVQGLRAPFRHAVQLPYLPPQPIPTDAPKGCLFVAEWGKARSDAPTSNLTKKVNTMWNMAAEMQGRGGKGGMVHGMRSLGSAALDLVYVATGAADIFYESGCWEWDVCAGVAIINEAGGRVVPSLPPQGLEEAGDIPDCDLGSRMYLAVRPCAPADGETAKEAQDRLIRSVWRRCEKIEYSRPQ
ncbi:hypothetical protein OIV83_005149 [Microbotryomycetes sp. JL201]|nr:hypothetical protein OIV83_005149 [Microbotryomycetes sp. JL201]